MNGLTFLGFALLLLAVGVNYLYEEARRCER